MHSFRIRKCTTTAAQCSEENRSPPVHFQNLEALSLEEVKINPLHMTFGKKLRKMMIEDVQFINQGTWAQLFATVTNLEDLTIREYNGLVVDVSELNMKKLVKLKIVAVEFCYTNNSSLSYDGDLQNLKDAEIEYDILANGTVEDFFKTAQNLEYLNLAIPAFDITKLPCTKSLRRLSTRSGTDLTCSDNSVVFETLDDLYIFSKHRLPCLNSAVPSSNFNMMFPNLSKLEITSIVSPNLLLSAIKIDNLKVFKFGFDFLPPRKTYEFGACLKFLSTLTEKGEEKYFSLLENIKKEERARDLEIIKVILKNGSFEWKLKSEIDDNIVETSNEIPPATKLIVYTYYVVLLIITILGVLSNSLSACVLVKSKMWTSGSGIVLLSLTFCDAIVIITYLIISFFSIELFYGFFIKEEDMTQFYSTQEHIWMAEQNVIQALTVYPINKTAYTGSVYLTVLISLERFIAICFPLRSKTIFSYKNTRRGIMVILGFSLILNFPRWIESVEWNFYSEDSPNWNLFYKPTLMRMRWYILVYHHISWPILMYIIPFLIIGILNFKILQQMRINIRARQSLTGACATGTGATDRMDAEMASLNRMLLSVVAVFVLCNALHIILVFYFFLGYDGIEPSTIEAIAGLPLIINSSVNFIIYVALGTKFRGEFLKLIPKCLISCWGWCKCINCGHPQTSSQATLVLVDSGGAHSASNETHL